MKRLTTLAVCLLLPAFLAAQTPMPPAQPQTEKKAAMPAKTRHCAECSMDFKNMKEAKAHFAKAHGMKFYCAHCNMAFKTKAEFTAHKKECMKQAPAASAHPAK
ncbi:MAG: hypothetical protein HY926_05215 [Elusimicrobia bacterium]|nr:hypothetical protein [Elusimicrobiota bacterium]